MDETLNIILDSEQIIFKKTTKLQRTIQKILNKLKYINLYVFNKIQKLQKFYLKVTYGHLL